MELFSVAFEWFASGFVLGLRWAAMLLTKPLKIPDQAIPLM